MDELRWILLLVGVAVVAAVYFSGRFESEDWMRERKRSRTGRHDKADNRKKITAKKEPVMGETEPEPDDTSPINVFEDEPATGTVSPKVPHTETIPVESVTKTEQKIRVDHKIETIRAEHPSIEDEITEIEIPVDFAVAEAEIHIADIATVSDEEPEQAVISPGIEPLVLSVSVFADGESDFSGPEIKAALEAEGLLHGAMRIFHFHDPDKKTVSENDDAVFSVASVVEPGFFDLEKLDEMQTPGLMLFCQLPGPLSGEDALDVMLDKGRGLAVRLHGHMCDDKRNRFTAQAKNHYLDRITAFNRKLVLARKKTLAN